MAPQLFLAEFATKYSPAICFVIVERVGSRVGDAFVFTAAFESSSASILFLCSINSNSVLKNTAKHNAIDKPEIMYAK